MDAVIQRLRQPEYTGENRCTPCTLVNAVIGGLLAGSVSWAAFAAGGSLLQAALVGTSVLLLAGAAIGLRGYLVPGTPELTRRYLPRSVLRAFGKAEGTGSVEGPATDEEFDVERLLVDAAVLEPRADGEDLGLTTGFERAWIDRLDGESDSGSDGERDRLFDLLGVDAGDLTVDEHGEAFRALVDDQVVGTWESRAAFEADLAAGSVLEEWGVQWSALDVAERGEVLSALRLFLETCPSCGGRVAFATETRESCCTSHEVAVVNCEGCDARLFESQVV